MSTELVSLAKWTEIIFKKKFNIFLNFYVNRVKLVISVVDIREWITTWRRTYLLNEDLQPCVGLCSPPNVPPFIPIPHFTSSNFRYGLASNPIRHHRSSSFSAFLFSTYQTFVHVVSSSASMNLQYLNAFLTITLNY